MTPREKEIRLTLSKTFGVIFSLDYFVVNEGGTCGTFSINYNGVGGVMFHDLVKLGEIFGSKKITVSWETDVQNLVVTIRDAEIPSSCS